MTVRDFCFDVDPDTKINLIKEEQDGEQEEKEVENMILVNAAFFRAEQVESVSRLARLTLS